MKKKCKPEEFNEFENWAEPTYQTGSTCPPKSHGGVIAFLLVAVIFLCGISTALSVMNFQLLEELNDEDITEPPPVAFSQGEDLVVPDNAVAYPLGFVGQPVPAFWQDYRDLPAGIYVAEVTVSPASRSLGLQTGDILTRLDGMPITDEAALQIVLEAHKPGDLLEAEVNRDGQQLIITLVME